MSTTTVAVTAVETAEKSGRLDATAAANLRKWLTDPGYASQRQAIEALIAASDFDELQSAFGSVIPFGTGGRRGAMGPGPNRINERTIAESAEGLAKHVRKSAAASGAALQGGPAGISNGRPSSESGVNSSSTSRAAGTHVPSQGPGRVVIAYDTRHHSREFAEVAAGVVAANGLEALLFESPRSTPELSFAVRHLGARAGIVISASHNPPSDNGFKAYWSDGGQVVPPDDQAIIDEVAQASTFDRLDLKQAAAQGLFRIIGAEVDDAYVRYTAGLSLVPARALKIVFTPLHGTGTTSVAPSLARAGFGNVLPLEGQWSPDPEFSGVPGRSPNPENPAALEMAVGLAKSSGAHIVMASDPDADRLGAVVLHRGQWMFLTGNRIGVLIFEHVARTMAARKSLPKGAVFFKTCVTSDLFDRIAEAHGVRVDGDFLVGFKYIAEAIEKLPDPAAFVFGTEESHGYLRGEAVRDKDAAQAGVLLAERAAELAAEGRTLVDGLEDIWARYGYYFELTRSIPLQGTGGGALGVKMMEALRAAPPQTIADEPVVAVVDRKTGAIVDPRTRASLGQVPGAKGNVLVFHLEKGGGQRVSIRPSGTEPKIKVYIQIRESGKPGSGTESRAAVEARAERLAADFAELTRRA